MNNTPYIPTPPVIPIVQNIGPVKSAPLLQPSPGTPPCATCMRDKRIDQDTPPTRTQFQQGVKSRHDSIVLFDTAPYPTVTGPHDPETVEMLKSDYAGAGGELTAITQYIFQNNSVDDETFSNALLQIAIVEMTHLDMLGDAIHALGGSTEFSDGHRFWSAEYVDYSLPRIEMLRANIRAERGAIRAYNDHAARTSNSSVRDLLLRIASDEKLHLQFFQDQLAQELAKDKE